MRPELGESGASRRAIATLLFTDIAGSTESAARAGDRAWRELLAKHNQLTSSRVAAHRGRVIKTTGDGVLAVFDEPGEGVRCAVELAGAARMELGLGLRAGMHLGEFEFLDQDVTGIAVHIAARVCERAAAGQVLVTETVEGVCTGAELVFRRVGSPLLKGVGRRWALFSAHLPTEGADSPTGGPRTAARSARGRRSPRAAATTSSERGQVGVLIVDDHPLWRKTIGAVLHHAKAGMVLAEAGDGVEAVALAVRHRPHVVLMDMDLPRQHGTEATREIAARLPDTKVLILSSSQDPAQVLEAIRAGASGYLLKSAEAEEICSAVGRIMAGELVLPPELASVALDAIRGAARSSAGAGAGASPLDALTEREQRVLDLMAEGRSNQAISSALHLSAKTVEGHISSIFTKLGLETSPEDHRRVRAVLVYIEARRDDRAGGTGGQRG